MCGRLGKVLLRNFTANMETLLDGVEEGTVKWKTIVENFYPDLDAAVKKAEKDPMPSSSRARTRLASV